VETANVTGCGHGGSKAATSLGSFSEAIEVFEPDRISQIIGELAGHLGPDHLYVTDRGFEYFALFNGIVEDVVGRLGSPKSRRIEHPNHLVRIVRVKAPLHPKRGGRRPRAAMQDLVLATNLLDVPAEIIALIYQHRWTGRKPSLRTYEMICYYVIGLADEEELLAHLAKLKTHET